MLIDVPDQEAFIPDGFNENYLKVYYGNFYVIRSVLAAFWYIYLFFIFFWFVIFFFIILLIFLMYDFKLFFEVLWWPFTSIYWVFVDLFKKREREGNSIFVLTWKDIYIVAGRLFPHADIFKWMSYGNGKSNLLLNVIFSFSRILMQLLAPTNCKLVVISFVIFPLNC